MIDLRADWLATLRGLLAQHVPMCEVRVFGSRYKGTATPASDLDLALVGPQPLPWKTLARLRMALEDSNLPFRVDVLDWHTLAPEFEDAVQICRPMFVTQRWFQTPLVNAWVSSRKS